jgi:hypothetical protein
MLMKYSANKNSTVVLLEVIGNDKYLISLSRLHLYKLIIVQVIKKLSTFYETPNSLPCSQSLHILKQSKPVYMILPYVFQPYIWCSQAAHLMKCQKFNFTDTFFSFKKIPDAAIQDVLTKNCSFENV